MWAFYTLHALPNQQCRITAGKNNKLWRTNFILFMINENFKSEVLMWIVSLNVVHMKIASHIRPCIFDTNNNTYRLMCYSCVCCVNALTATLWVGWQKSPVACNNICSSNPQVVTQETFLAPKHTGIDFFTSIQTVTVTSLPSSAILTELHGYLFTLKSSSS